MNNFSGLIWLLFMVGSYQKRAIAFFPSPSYRLMISLHVILVGVYRDIVFSPLSLEQALFYEWLSIEMCLFEVLFPYNDQGQNSTASVLLFGIKLIKNPIRSA